MNLKKTQYFLFGVFALFGVTFMVIGASTFIPRLLSGNLTTLPVGLTFMMFGLIFGLIGVIPIMNMIKKDKKHANLIQNGRVLTAKIESIYLNTSIRVNGYNPYVVTCTYTDEYTGQVLRFKSHNIWEGEIGMAQVGQDIKVYVDPADYHTYYVSPESTIPENMQNNNIIDM